MTPRVPGSALQIAGELDLLAVRLKELEAALPEQFRSFVVSLGFGVRQLAGLLREYDQTGPDCYLDTGCKGR